jgi:predicted TIM-barrel fold metal-dependent hydrolase
MRIDSHVHIMPPKRLQSLVRWILKAFPDHPVSQTITGDDVLADLRSAGVTHFFNLIYPLREEETDFLNEFNAAFCRETPGAIAFASLHQETVDKAKVAERALAMHDFVGFKFHPFVQRFDPWDHRMAPLYGFLEEVGRPVLFHTGFETFYGQSMPVTELEGLLKRYPRLPMVFVHMAAPELPTVLRMMADYPELVLDATNVLALARAEYRGLFKLDKGSGDLIEVLTATIERYSHRIMFGSDHPVGMGTLPAIYADLKLLSLRSEIEENLQFRSAVTFVNRFLPGFDWERRLSS